MSQVQKRPGKFAGGVLAVLGVGLAAAGCSSASSSREVYVGSRSNPIYATYSFGALEAQIPEPLPVRSAGAAAEATLRERGYMITSVRTTDDLVRVEARPPSREGGKRWVVESRATSDGQTLLSVECRPWGEDGASRVMMDAILQRLGR